MTDNKKRLPGWMHFVLRFGGVYNITAGLSMVLFYHEGFKALGLEKPDFNMPIQLVGVLVAIFGIGYLMADRDPMRSANLVFIGMLSKILGPLLAFAYIARGELSPNMIPVLLVADIVYLIPFWMIYKQINRQNNGANDDAEVAEEDDATQPLRVNRRVA